MTISNEGLLKKAGLNSLGAKVPYFSQFSKGVVGWGTGPHAWILAPWATAKEAALLVAVFDEWELKARS
jgi:hypothetical protein